MNTILSTNLCTFNNLHLANNRTRVGVIWADGSVSIQHKQMSQIPEEGETEFTAENAGVVEREIA